MKSLHRWGLDGLPKISGILPDFLGYAQYDLDFSDQTIGKYRDSIRLFIREVGDLGVTQLTPEHFISLKQKMSRRGVSGVYIATIIFAMKSLLHYCRNFKKLDVLDPALIRAPKRKRRDVLYLQTEEVEQFISVINLNAKGGLRFRTLVEVLLGTGARISEALSIQREGIDYEKREAKVVGKGSKERILFFTERSLSWVKRYLATRQDTHEALFVTLGPQTKRLRRDDMSRYFKHYCDLSGVGKRITPHVLRHTMATNLLFNGCPVGHIKEILGHDRLDTTCRYYLGLDRNKAKEAHTKYLSFQ